MLLFLLYIKKPKYLWGMALPLFLAWSGWNAGNHLTSIAALFVSFVFWTAACLAYFLGKEEVDTNIGGFDIKNAISVFWIFIWIEAAVLFFLWPVIAFVPHGTRGEVHLLPYLFVPTILNVMVGSNIVKAKIVVGLAKSGIKLRTQDFQRIFEDLRNLIASS